MKIADIKTFKSYSEFHPGETEEAFENRIGKKLLKEKPSLFHSIKKGDGYLGKCKNGRFEIHLPVTLGSSNMTNSFGSCVYGRYEEKSGGLALTYRFGRTLAAWLDTLLITIILASAVFVACTTEAPALIPVITVANIVYLVLFLRVPGEDKEELRFVIQGQY